jgi:phosphoribosylformylglycinamidine (FGAM) synthase-like amidotransferase family enzyme
LLQKPDRFSFAHVACAGAIDLVDCDEVYLETFESFASDAELAVGICNNQY